MFGFSAPAARPGRPIPAAAIDRPASEVARRSRARPGGAVAAIEAAGATLPYSTARRRWLVRITAVGTGLQAGAYAWQAVYPQDSPPSSYGDVPGRSGSLASDPAFELNATSTLSVGDRVEVYREWYSGEVRFQLDLC